MGSMGEGGDRKLGESEKFCHMYYGGEGSTTCHCRSLNLFQSSRVLKESLTRRPGLQIPAAQVLKLAKSYPIRMPKVVQLREKKKVR